MDIGILTSQICRKWPNPSTPCESVESLIDRVATTLSSVEVFYGKSSKDVDYLKREIIDQIETNKFWPSGRILNNAGSRQGQLASCFVLPIMDDFDSIFDTLSIAAKCHRGGGGTGFNFSKLREQGSKISSCEAAGAPNLVSWMKLIDTETTSVMSGGKMRGANMGILSVYHPDIIKFIQSKNTVGELNTFSLSVLIDDNFMTQLQKNEEIRLCSPLDGRTVSVISAKRIWEEIAAQAWKTGDPGILFTDKININNNLRSALGNVEATNPCGEQALYDYESSVLGSLNLSAFYDNASNDVDWEALAYSIGIAVRALDNSIDVCKYPDDRISAISKLNRRLGLGVMGYADLLIKLGTKYDSNEAINLIEKLGEHIKSKAWKVSQQLAAEKGSFPNHQKSDFKMPMRNCAVTAIAPTGTISMIAECSNSIEPKFAPVYKKNVVNQNGLDYVDKQLLEEIEILNDISTRDAKKLLLSSPFEQLNLPDQIRNKYRYSNQIDSHWHILTTATWQKYIDNGVSKTISFKSNTTKEQIEEAFLQSWQCDCKGISIYRSNSRSRDLMTVPESSDQPIMQSKSLSETMP